MSAMIVLQAMNSAANVRNSNEVEFEFFGPPKKSVLTSRVSAKEREVHK